MTEHRSPPGMAVVFSLHRDFCLRLTLCTSRLLSRHISWFPEISE